MKSILRPFQLQSRTMLVGIALMLSMHCATLSAPAPDPAVRELDQLISSSKNKEALAKLGPLLTMQPNNISYRTSRAIALMNLNQYSAAVPELTRVLEKLPGDLYLRKLRAFAYFQLNDFKKGIDDCSAILKSQPGDAEARMNRATAYQKLGMHSLERADLDQLASMGYSQSVMTLIKKLSELVAADHLDEANAIIKRETSKNANVPVEVLFLAGQSSFDSQEYELGIRYMTQCISKQPKYSWMWRTALLFRARCKLNTLKYQSALADTELAMQNESANAPAIQLFKLTPPFPNIFFEAYTTKAEALAALGQFDKSVATLTEQINRFPLVPTLYLSRSQKYLRLKKYQLALADCDKILSLAHQNKTTDNESRYTDAILAKFDIYCAQEDFSKALSAVNDLQKLSPEDEEIYLERGYVLYRLGKYSAAVDDYNKAISLDSNQEGFYYIARAAAYRKMGKTALADADEQKGKRLGSKRKHYMHIEPSMMY